MQGHVRRIDVGRAGSHYFCSASCLGYFAEIAAESHDMKGLRGSPRYIAAALSVIRRLDSGWTMQVTADGQTFSGEYAVLLVSNAPRFGGLTMLPGAECDDGALDCLLIEMAGKLEALHLIALVYRQARRSRREHEVGHGLRANCKVDRRCVTQPSAASSNGHCSGSQRRRSRSRKGHGTARPRSRGRAEARCHAGRQAARAQCDSA